MAKPTGSIFIVVAPSGAGKTSLVAALLAADSGIDLSISFTTRAARVGEVDGKHYHFVSHETFGTMLERGDFLEHAEVYGNYYGTSARWIQERLEQGRDVLLEIDWQGYQQVHHLLPEAVSIFILPPSIAILEERLRGRGTDSEDVITRRLSAARFEISKLPEYDYVVVNDHFETARDELITVVRAARLRGLIQQRRHADRLAAMQPQE